MLYQNTFYKGLDLLAVMIRKRPCRGPEAAPLLEVRELRTWFDTDRGLFKAVDGISFSVGRGRTVGLVGESGCGKSVTSLSLMGLVPSPPGQVSAMRSSSKAATARPVADERVGCAAARCRWCSRSR
jgi:ABC-type glutathione transport system ATPase component